MLTTPPLGQFIIPFIPFLVLVCVKHLKCVFSPVSEIFKELKTFKSRSRDPGHAPFEIFHYPFSSTCQS